jgi:hypothetical protein
MLRKDTKTIVTTALRSAGVEQQKIVEALVLLDGNGKVKSKHLPAYVSQAEAGRLLSVSRFTVKKLVATGKIHPVELLPGLLRYRVEELLNL